MENPSQQVKYFAARQRIRENGVSPLAIADELRGDRFGQGADPAHPPTEPEGPLCQS